MTVGSQADLARRLGTTEGYVSQLGAADRLVRVEGGIDLEASEALIRATEDVSSVGEAQRERWAERRAALARAQAAGQGAAVAGQVPATPGEPPEGSGVMRADQAALIFRAARAKKMHEEAKLAQMQREEREGRLVDRQAVAALLAELGTLVRTGLERLPDTLAPELAAMTDADAIHALLVERVEEVLHDLAAAAAQRLAPRGGGQ